MVASPLWYVWAPHHMAYPGTATLKAETLTQVVVDLCESFVYHGFKKIVVINGHREANLPPLKIPTSKVRNLTGALVAIVDPFYIRDSVRLIIPSSVESNRTLGGISGVAADLTVASTQKGILYHKRVLHNFIEVIQQISESVVVIKKFPEVNA